MNDLAQSQPRFNVGLTFQDNALVLDDHRLVRVLLQLLELDVAEQNDGSQKAVDGFQVLEN